MFTGIVNHCGVIVEVLNKPAALSLKIQSQFEQFVLGESIAVDGICLTVTDFKQNIFSCDLSPETLQITTAKNFVLGQKVNLERALKVGDSLGGHWVNGHVDCTATVKHIAPQGEFCAMEFCLEQSSDLLKYLVVKGSIAVNGVSLTINHITSDGFSVMLIPETLATTNLSGLIKGAAVNIEIDAMSKLIVRQCEAWLKQNLKH